MPTIIGTDQQFVRRCTCLKCASIIEYTENETRERRSSYMGESCTETVIDCPKCKNVIILRSD